MRDPRLSDQEQIDTLRSASKAQSVPTPRRLIPPMLAGVIFAIAVALATVANADTKGIAVWFGSPGSAGGQLEEPKSVAVNPSTGDVYVADPGSNRVQRFGADGAFERIWGKDVVVAGGSGDTAQGGAEICTVAQQCKRAPNFSEISDGSVSGPDRGGEFTSLEGIAIDPANGSVYTTDQASGRVQKFNADGQFLRAWGRGVGATNEVQLITNGGPSPATSFTLTINGQTTDSISDGATPLNIREALVALSSIGPLGVEITGPQRGPWRVEFLGDLSGSNQPQLVASNGVSVTTVVGGSASATPNLCTVATDCEQGSSGTKGGEFGGSVTGTFRVAAIAVVPPGPPNAGNVLVGDGRNRRVQEFTSAGEFVRAFGWDVAEPGDDAAFEICTDALQCRPGTAGSGPGQFPAGQPVRLAADSSGAIYGSDTANARVQKFTPQAGPPALDPTDFAPAILTGGSPATDLAIGASNHLFVTKDDAVHELTPAGVETGDSPHMQGAGVFEGRGLAVNPVSDEIYVGSLEPTARIYVANTDSAPAIVSIDNASGVTPHGAVLSGLVNPNGPDLENGVRTRYRFEYREVGNPAWIQAQAAVDVGNGFDGIAVSRALKDLKAETEYEARLVALKDFATPEATVPTTFSTATSKPDVIAVAPEDRTAISATLNAWINPNNSATTYRFMYGLTDAYGTTVPDGSAGAGKATTQVTAPISGLQPETTYHFQVVAENALGVTESADGSFTTRASAPVPERGYEMVTPPFKVMRGAVSGGGPEGFNANPGWPSLDGESILWNTDKFPLTDDVASPFDGDKRIIRRTPHGWENNSLLTLSSISGSDRLVSARGTAASGDLSTFAWQIGDGGEKEGALLPTPGAEPLRYYTRRDGTGTNGFSAWLANTDTQVADIGFEQGFGGDAALLTDDGSAMARWGNYRGLAEDPEALGDEDPSDDQQLFGSAGGSAAYLQWGPPEGSLQLIGECTGATGGVSPAQAPAKVPTRVGSGLDSDTIGSRNCEQGEVTSVRGAAVGGNSGASSFQGSSGPSATALSEDGKRVFFTSPDPSASGLSGSCTSSTGAATDCPPQLFVRSHDSSGAPVVRWISHARGIGAQRIGELAPAIFQGASRNGRIVYFFTRSPLLPGDPNGGASITNGVASPSSTDLYRYTLPADPDADPDAGTLARISGGPNGDADPSASAVAQGPARFISDDGRRAYFVTEAPIDGADQIPPAGGVTMPGGAVGEESTRNLYLFDDTGDAPKWTFVARIPYSNAPGGTGATPDNLDRCASARAVPAVQMTIAGYSTGVSIQDDDGSCVRGTPGGEALTFLSRGQLVAEDTDTVADIYLYDARTDELERVSQPETAAPPYSCRGGQAGSEAKCFGDFGFAGVALSKSLDLARGWGGGRHTNIAIDGDGVVSVFFESRSSLAAEDTNGDRYDVYQWREGDLSLVSPGTTDDHSYYSGNGIDGRDVFIETSSRIDPREIDDHDFDIYDYRVGGGFPYTPPPEPCDVLALDCEGEAAPPPAPRTPVTPTLAGGNVVQPGKPRCAKGKARRKGRCVTKNKKTRAKKTRSKSHGKKGGSR